MAESSPVVDKVRALTRWSAEHPFTVLAGMLVVLVSSWGYASQLKLKTDFLQLLPTDSVAAKRFRDAVDRRRGSASTLLVMVESHDDDKTQRFIDAIEPELRKLPKALVGGVEHGPGEARTFIEKYRWLYASERDLERTACELEAARARAMPGYIELDDPCEDLRDPEPAPIDGKPAATPAADRGSKPKTSALRDFQARADAEIAKYDQFPTGYFRTPDGLTYTLVIRSASEGFGDSAGEQLMQKVQAICARAEPRFGIDPASVGFAGDVPSALADVQALRDDITIVSGAAVILIFGSIIFFFRSALSLLHIGVAVMTGCGIAFAVAMAAFGHLNNATGFLGSIIFGNGINYGIVYMARYRERRGLGDNVIDALCDAAATCLRATWLASLAASGAYAALMVTSFRGFSEFGLIGGVGMLACWTATFLVVPASIAALERIGARKGEPVQPQVKTPVADAIGAVTRKVPGLVMFVALALAVVAMLPLRGYLADPWEYDFRKLRSISSDQRGAGRWTSKSDEVFKTRGSPQLVLANSIDEVLGLAAQVKQADLAVTGGKFVDRVETIYDMLGGPPDSVQRKLKWLAEIRDHIDHVQKHLDDEERAIAQKWRPPEYLRLLTPTDLPTQLRERFTEKDGRLGTSLFVYLSPGISQSKGHNLLQISDLLARVKLPNGHAAPNAARATVFAEMIRSMERDAPRATLIALLVVIAVCLLVERRALPIAAVLGSLFCGVLWTVGGAAWLDVRLNFLNFVALPLTFGIGVEYAINLYERIRAENGDVTAGVRSVGGAVMLCSLTTIFGYGALLFADNQALRSFGRYAIAGELACITTALFVMPAALALARKKPSRN
ncbi:MAG TPA: MMPL family transporter [Polyangiales bacterium]